ncbi:hypothetical protein KKC88_03890 [Patescibacteria group bacterium]|nr:hypothetical protein [Patescibacteria group bacterium]MBU1673581.1 hypothetical protein [Patescibacteria group bacterium]MBU1963483.1 hypothetical protein [Patescibacteria group bacterium]
MAKNKKSAKTKQIQEKNKNLKKVLSIIFVILLVPSFIALVDLSTLKATIFNADFHKQNLVEANAYERIIDDGVPSIILTVKSEDDNIYSYLVRQGVILAWKKFVTPEWLQQQTELGIDRGMAYLYTPGDPDEILNYIQTFRSQILPNASRSLNLIETSIPTCEDPNNILKAIWPNLDCVSMNTTLDTVRTEIANISDQVDQVEVQVNDLSIQVEQYIKIFFALRGFLANLVTYIWIASLLCGLFIAAIVLLQYRNIASMLKWLATPFLIASILVLIPAYAVGNAFAVVIQSMVLNLTPAMNNIIISILSVTSANTFGFMKCFGWWTFGISLAVLIAGYIVERVNWIKFNKKVKSSYQDVIHKNGKKKEKQPKKK